MQLTEKIVATIILILVLTIIILLHIDPEEDESANVVFASGMPCERDWEDEQETSKEEIQEGVRNDSRRSGKKADGHDQIRQQNNDCIVRSSKEDSADYSGVVGHCSEVVGGEVDEQETSKEIDESWILEETAESDGYRVAGEGGVEAATDDVPEPVAETEAMETVQEPATSDTVEETFEVHAVVPAEETRLEDVLMHELEALGIGYFYQYAWAQAMQESHWNPNAVSPSGMDKGLFQYREKYWDEAGSIMDPYVQISKYVRQVKARLDAGLSIEETISRHYTSDWVTDINWDYVNAVLSWLR